MTRNMKITLAIVISVAVIGLILFLVLERSEAQSRILDKSWKRTYTIERFQWVTLEDSSRYNYPTIDSNARNVNRWDTQEVYYTSMRVGKTTMVIPHFYTLYHVRWEGQRWRFDHTLQTQGDVETKPKWPEFSPTDDLRKAYQSESYKFIVALDKDKPEFVIDRFDYWTKWRVGARCQLLLNIFKSILDILPEQKIAAN